MSRHRKPRAKHLQRGACRSGHSYGPGQRVGAGILRYLCSTCGSVSIDISGVDVPEDTGSLFVTVEDTLERT